MRDREHAASVSGREIAEMLANARKSLLDMREPSGHWRGELSSSALSTAVAAFALHMVDPGEYVDAVSRGMSWLAKNRNDDGGWGDTTASSSNMSTTLLCWSALSATARGAPSFQPTVAGAAHWLESSARRTDANSIASVVLRHYGNDRTFAAPILAMCAMAGTLGDGDVAWEDVPQLPFEFAVCPPRVFRWLSLSVVSYAIPALIAVGLVRHRHCPVASAPRTSLRNAVTPRALRVLERMQPESGGFLEATPLTAFVTMSLAASELRSHRVVQEGVRFLLASQREDGSWPIDSDLATWVTTLSVNALSTGGDIPFASALRQWLLSQQTRTRDPFTAAAPGGWGWTDRPGSVPDADDTSGALLALRRLMADREADPAVARRGVLWLLNLQNRDGGWPTFCRGWGRLPFDRSCPDITAHALRALDEWYDSMDVALQRRINAAMQWSVSYLEKVQREDGSWVPLWFGNEAVPNAENPTYGTARVVSALNSISPGRLPRLDHLVESGCRWLAGSQRDDGGWGGDRNAPPSVEETAVSVEALAGAGMSEFALRGSDWLMHATDRGRSFPTAPIGLYFASLWYSEKLYPVVFTVSALETVVRMLR